MASVTVLGALNGSDHLFSKNFEYTYSRIKIGDCLLLSGNAFFFSLC